MKSLIFGLFLILALAACGSVDTTEENVMAKSQYLVEVDAYDPITATVKTLRYSQRGYTTPPTGSPANTPYPPRVSQPGKIRRDIFDKGTTMGFSRNTYGEITLINNDGGLDPILKYGMDGRKCTVKLVGHDPANPHATITVLSGTIEQPVGDLALVSLRFRDSALQFQKPYPMAKYLGTNTNGAGVEGESDLKDKVKPVIFGGLANCPVVLVNPAKLIYQISNSGVSTSVVNTYINDKGVQIPQDPAWAFPGAIYYANQAQMEATAPAAGTCIMCPSKGMFRLGSTPAGKVTAKIYRIAGNSSSIQSGYNLNSAPAIIKYILDAMPGFDSSAIVTQDIYDMVGNFGQSMIPNPPFANSTVSLRIDNETTTYEQIINQLCESANMWVGYDKDGLFRLKRFLGPATTSVATITNLIKINKVASNDPGKGVPVSKVTLNYGKNYSPLSPGDYAGSVPLASQEFYSREYVYQTIAGPDTSVLTRHLLAPELLFNTQLLDTSATPAEVDRLLALYSVDRDTYEITIQATPALLAVLDLGQTITLKYNRFGLNYGKNFVVIGYESDLKNNRISLTIWG